MFFIEEFIEKAGELEKMEDSRLTYRQNQIMTLMSDGKDKQEISNILGVEISTIASQIVDIYSRYGLCGDYKNSKAVVMFLRNTGRLE